MLLYKAVDIQDPMSVWLNKHPLNNIHWGTTHQNILPNRIAFLYPVRRLNSLRIPSWYPEENKMHTGV